MADDPVVVMKFPPMKPGNGVEGKTGMTCIVVYRGCRVAKSACNCEGGKFIRKSWKTLSKTRLGTIRLTRRARIQWYPLEKGSIR